MNDDLIKELRDLSAGPSVEMQRIGNKAADRIEQLEREKARLGREVNIVKCGEPYFAWSMRSAAMVDLQIKLAKAVEALHFYADFGNHLAGIRTYAPIDLDKGGKAEEVLAELEGK